MAAEVKRSTSPILERAESAYPANRKIYRCAGELELDSMLYMPVEVEEKVAQIRGRLFSQGKIDSHGQLILPSDIDRKVTKLLKKADRDRSYNAFWSVKGIDYATLTQEDVDALGSTIEGIRREYDKYKKQHHGKSTD